MRSGDLLRLFAIMSVAICLVPAGAHFFELPNKLALSPADYMIVQRIYVGWAWFGVAILAAIAMIFAYTVRVWSYPAARGWALMAFLAMVATQVVFWTYTYPMNAITRQWTVTPPNLELVRLQWEYSHAVNATLTLIALIAIVSAVLAERHPGPGPRTQEATVPPQPLVR